MYVNRYGNAVAKRVYFVDAVRVRWNGGDEDSYKSGD